MKIIDVHPDDLLDREIDGTLSGDERRRLRDHLERCMQCRLERQLRSDFEEEQSAVDDARDIQSFVSGALRAARTPTAQRPRRKAASSTWHRRLVFVLAATMVLATGLAAAEVEFAGHTWSGLRQKIAFVFRSPPRESPAIDIIEKLLERGATVKAFDPVAMEEAKHCLPAIEYASDEYDAIDGADVLVIITEWNQFRALDMERVKSLLRSPKIADLRNIYEPQDMRDLGFEYVGVGR